MLSKRTANKGQSFIEYITMIIFILIALIVFQKYIARGIYGRWKAAGDSLSSGAGLYDLDKTLECEYDYVFTNTWYNVACYDINNCAKVCYGVSSSSAQCISCINGCHTSSSGVTCND